MTIRRRICLLLVLIMSCAYLLLFINSKYIILHSFEKLEQYYMRLNLNRVSNDLQDELNAIRLVNEDWAYWDDTYKFILDGNTAYIRECSLDSKGLQKLKLNVLIYVNSQGTIIWSQGWDLQRNLPEKVAPQLIDMVTVGNSKAGSDWLGFILLDEGKPMMISALPILNSAAQGPPRGTLYMGRYLEHNKIKEINDRLHLQCTLHPWNPGLLPFQQTKSLAFHKGKQPIIKPSLDSVSGYTLLQDIYHKPALLLKVETPRDIYERGQAAIQNFALFLLLVSIIMGLFIFWMVDKVILCRIDKLVKGIASIAASGDLSTRLDSDGNDELTVVIHEANHMLDEIEQTQLQLKESREQYQRLFDDALSANYIATIEGKVLLCNDAYVQMFGFDKMEDALQTPITDLYSREDDRLQLLNQVKETGALSNQELVLIHKTGKQVNVLCNIRGVFDKEGNLNKVLGYIIDLTDYNHAQQEVRYLSFYDKLTGIHNRAFFEEQLALLDKPEYLPLSLIMGDVNGLKLVNDALGHLHGDKLLVEVASRIQATCRQNDIVARWGGDEFLVLLPRTQENIATNISERIRISVEGWELEGIQVSISLGTATKETMSENMDDVLSRAEERMYRNKLLQQHSNRNAIISTLVKTLQSKSYETEEHARHLRDLAAAVGKKLALPSNEIDELELLATLHDIGKVSIPDHILKKATALSSDEWEVMKKHSEVGFRIAKATPELVPIAEGILAHHERWDGKGYPLGLGGEEIPLIARIISIANAYYVMIEGRPYKEKISPKEAISELKRCSGTLFDPQLVEVFTDIIESSD